MIPVTDLRSGVVFAQEGNLWQVVKYEHTKMGRGSATVKVKVKNLKTGGVTEKTFMSGARVDDVTLEKKKAQYLYKDANGVTFMDPETYEQFTIPSSILGAGEKLLTEGVSVTVLVHNDTPVNIEWPHSMEFRVTSADPGIKGDSVSNIMKGAMLENGMQVQVPLFIKEGDRVKINPRTGEYAGRVKK